MTTSNGPTGDLHLDLKLVRWSPRAWEEYTYPEDARPYQISWGSCSESGKTATEAFGRIHQHLQRHYPEATLHLRIETGSMDLIAVRSEGEVSCSENGRGPM